MGVKKDSLGKTTASDRIEFTWTATIGRLVKQIGLPGFAPKPDLAKLKAAMDKEKKPLEWFFEFDNVKCVFQVEATIGGTTIVIGKFEVLANKDRQARRDALKSLFDHTAVVVKKDLDDFDAKFPAPPDPKVLEALKEDIRKELFFIKRDGDLKNGLPTSFKTMDDGLRQIGFMHWAEGLRLDRFVDFVIRSETSEDPKVLALEFLVTGAKRILQIKAPIREKIEADLKAGKKIDLAPAVKDVGSIIDATMLPRFRKDTIAGLDKDIAEHKKTLAQKQAELKKLLGK